ELELRGTAHRLEPAERGDFVEQARGVEILARKLARRPRMARIVGVDHAQRVGRRGGVVEAEQPGAGRDEFFEAGELSGSGAPSGQIAHRAIAEPSRASTDVE